MSASSSLQFQAGLLSLEDQGRIARIGWTTPKAPGPAPIPALTPTWTYTIEWRAVSSVDVGQKEEVSGKQTHLLRLEFPFDTIRVRVTAKSALLGDLSYRPQEVSHTFTIAPLDTPEPFLNELLTEAPGVLAACMMGTSSRNDLEETLASSPLITPSFRSAIKPLPDGTFCRRHKMGSLELSWFEFSIAAKGGYGETRTVAVVIPLGDPPKKSANSSTSATPTTQFSSPTSKITETAASTSGSPAGRAESAPRPLSDFEGGVGDGFYANLNLAANPSRSELDAITPLPSEAVCYLVCGYSTTNSLVAMKVAKGLHEVLNRVAGGPAQASNVRHPVPAVACISFAACLPHSTYTAQTGQVAAVESLEIFPLQRFTKAQWEQSSGRFLDGELKLLKGFSSYDNLTSRTDALYTFQPIDEDGAAEVTNMADCTDMSSQRLLAVTSFGRSDASMDECVDLCRPSNLTAALSFDLNCSITLVLTGINLRSVTEVGVHLSEGSYVALRIEQRTNTRLTARQSLLPFLNPPEEEQVGEETLTRVGSEYSSPFMKIGSRPKMDWRREWDAHISISTPISLDIHNYGAIRFPEEVVGVLSHVSSRLTAEVLLSKAVLLQPICTEWRELLHGDTSTLILAEFELAAATVAATVNKVNGSKNVFTQLVQKAAAKVGTVPTLAMNSLIHPETPKQEDVIRQTIRKYHQANKGHVVSPQVLLEWLIQPLKGMLDLVPDLKEGRYRAAMLEMMQNFTSHKSTESEASIGVLEYELYGYMLRFLRHCNVNHASHHSSITEFTTFPVFYSHLSRKLLATKYLAAKNSEALHLFQDVVFLWCVALMHSLRRYLRTTRFVLVTGSQHAGKASVSRVLRTLVQESVSDEKKEKMRNAGGERLHVATVVCEMTLSIALDSCFEATLVLVGSSETDNDVVYNRIKRDVLPRVKQRSTQRCVLCRNKLDEFLVSQSTPVARVEEGAAAFHQSIADAQATLQRGESELELAIVAAAPTPASVAGLAARFNLPAGEILSKLSDFSYEQLRRVVLPELSL